MTDTVDLMAALLASLAARPEASQVAPGARQLADLRRARELDRRLGLGSDEDEPDGCGDDPWGRDAEDFHE